MQRVFAHLNQSRAGWAASLADAACSVLRASGCEVDPKRPTAASSEGEARLRALTDALPQMIWVARATDGAITYANQRFRDYFGEASSTRRDRIAAHHPDDRERAASAWAAADRDGRAFEVEARWRRRDGAYRWHKLILTPLVRRGAAAEWLGSALDIDDIVLVREALREKTDLLHFAQQAAGAGLFDWDIEGGSARLSAESLALFGLPLDRTDGVGVQEILDAIHPDDLAGIEIEAERVKMTRTDYRVEFRVPRPEASDRWILGLGRVVVDTEGRASRIVGLNLDVTERKRVEQTLRVSEERLALALDSGSDGLWDWEVDTGVVWYSDRWQSMLGYEPGEIEPHIDAWERLVHPEDRDGALERTEEHFAGRSPVYECEHRLRRKDGDWGWILSRGKVVGRTPTGRPLRVVGTHIDIGARKAAELQIAHMARHDALTDLPNRTMFRDRLAQRLAGLTGDAGSCAVLCLDLDHFKAVNDRLGHLAGDALLREVAARLKSLLGPRDLLARLGGDEFAIVLDEAGPCSDVMDLARRLSAVVNRPILIGEKAVEVGLSVGVALAPQHGCDSEGLFRRADLAMYRAKAEGRGAARCFEPEMDEEAAERRALQQDLRRAIHHEELVLHYQPQLTVATGEVVGFEALVRWRHPVKGVVPPSRFIPLAEETGLICDLDAWVLLAACREAVLWPKPLRVAVNVSARQFGQDELPEQVLAALARTGLSPGRLEIEVTESVIINDMSRALGILRRLKGIGVRIAMDDFGTGYSSLATLQAFPFDKIKMDRTFVGNLGQSRQAEVIVRAILGLGRNLGLEVVAEGIETAAQLSFIADEGCDEMQGFLLGRPQPIEDYAEVVGRRTAAASPCFSALTRQISSQRA